MDKAIRFLILNLRGVPVGLISGLTDAGMMYSLGRFTDVNLDHRVYISSALGMIVSFIGNYLWTFKHGHNPSPLEIKLLKFMIIHIILTIIHAKLSIYIINYINTRMKDISNDSVFTRVTKLDKGERSLTNISEVIVKQVSQLLFYIMNIFIMQYIF